MIWQSFVIYTSKLTCKKVLKFLCTCLLYAIFVTFLFVFSVLSYTTFYYLYIPVNLTQLDLNFLIEKYVLNNNKINSELYIEHSSYKHHIHLKVSIINNNNMLQKLYNNCNLR